MYTACRLLHQRHGEQIITLSWDTEGTARRCRPIQLPPTHLLVTRQPKVITAILFARITSMYSFHWLLVRGKLQRQSSVLRA